MKKNMPFTSIDQIPCTMNADEVAAYLNVSKSGAYTVMHSKGFPVIHIGKRMVVLRDKFLQWVEDQVGRD